MTAVWRLRGRDTELSELGVLLRRRRSALLAGPSGVGKTSLAMAAAAALEPSGSAVVRVVASQPTASVPLGALAVLLPPTRLPPQGSVTASSQVRTGIVAIAGDGPALLVVDDAQWLDEASAVVVHQLVAEGHVAVLATLRTGVLAPAPVTALWKDGLVERVDVAPLGDAAVREVLETALDGPVETLTASRLWRRCSGNALYFRELVGEAERLGLLQQRDGVWCIDTLPPGSPRLAELVGRVSTPSTSRRAPLSSWSRWASRSGSGCSTRWSIGPRWSGSSPLARSSSTAPATMGWCVPRIRCSGTSCAPVCASCAGAGSWRRWPISSSAAAPRHATTSSAWRCGGSTAGVTRPPSSCSRLPARPTSPSTGRRPSGSLAPPGPPTTASRQPASSPTCCSGAGSSWSATRWARRATELAARCEAPAVVELAGAAGTAPLTHREREIALLAADGLASRVIAERLYVSVRTVDNHLGRICTKLGLASRAELAELLRR